MSCDLNLMQYSYWTFLPLFILWNKNAIFQGKFLQFLLLLSEYFHALLVLCMILNRSEFTEFCYSLNQIFQWSVESYQDKFSYRLWSLSIKPRPQNWICRPTKIAWMLTWFSGGIELAWKLFLDSASLLFAAGKKGQAGSVLYQFVGMILIPQGWELQLALGFSEYRKSECNWKRKGIRRMEKREGTEPQL